MRRGKGKWMEGFLGVGDGGENVGGCCDGDGRGEVLDELRTMACSDMENRKNMSRMACTSK